MKMRFRVCRSAAAAPLVRGPPPTRSTARISGFGVNADHTECPFPMKFTNEKKSPICVEGRGENEDVVTVNDRSAWVLDGGTGLGDVNVTPAATDAKWYVDRFDAYLRDRIHDREQSLREIVRDGIDRVSTEYVDQCGEERVPSGDLPTATCAIVRLEEAADPRLNVFVLGDCTATLSGAHQPTEMVHDDRLHRFDREAATKLQSRVRDGMSFGEARRAILPILRENRRQRNNRQQRSDDTYWVLGMKPTAAEHGYAREFEVVEDRIVTGFTDGFRRLVDTYELFPRWLEALSFLERTDLQVGVDAIRSVEESDPDCSTYPRLKPRDDVAAFQLRVTPWDG